MAGPGWFPSPRVSAENHNARWSPHFCGACERHCLALITTAGMAPNDEIVVPSAPFPDSDKAQWPLEVTFDGGARTLDGDQKVAGAGATLWRHRRDGGPPDLVASCVIAIPGCDNAQLAEATGCRAGLGLLTLEDPSYRAARIAGDNLAVIRYGRGTGRFRNLRLCAQMDLGLAPLTSKGWQLHWVAIRRRLNKAADRLATLGVFWAARLRANGDTSTRTWVVKHADSSHDIPLHFPSVSCASLDPEEVRDAADDLEATATRNRRALTINN